MRRVKAVLDERQVPIYLGAIVVGVLAGVGIPGVATLESAIDPALAFMLFVTFLQVPLPELGMALRNTRFLVALLATNFILMPMVTVLLIQLLPDEPMLRLAVMFVLLTPCVDYVVAFTHLGRGDAKLMLAATPVLLLLQMALLPVYLRVLLGSGASGLVQPEPFVRAFAWLIGAPLVLAAALQFWEARTATGKRTVPTLGLLPVPATAFVLFLVVAAVMPQIGSAAGAALTAAPIYAAYAVIAPLIGWMVARACRLDVGAARAVAFSAATRNSLVILPLTFAVPNGVPLVPAVVVTQTLIELLSELIYVRWIPRLSDNLSCS